MTDDLTAWLLEQIAEDEALARRNTDGHGLGDGFPDYRTYDGPDLDAADEYIDRFGPARLLAECAAKRQIIKACRPFAVRDCSTDGEAVAWAVLVQLAAPFADRPGYREEWRP